MLRWNSDVTRHEDIRDRYGDVPIVENRLPALENSYVFLSRNTSLICPIPIFTEEKTNSESIFISSWFKNRIR